MTYRGFGYVVDSCPTNKTEFISAATRLNCSEDKYGRNQYTCVPNEVISALVEFCYSKIVGIYQKGHCLVTFGNGALDQISCRQFKYGCPEENFRGTGVYKFSACSRINKEKQCYLADPSCSDTTTNATMKMLTTETSNTDLESNDVKIIIGTFLSLLLLLLFLVFAIIFWKRKNLRRYQSVELEENHTVDDYIVWGTSFSGKEQT
ncbi:uncharacterized protein LOC134235767, partial [Saccostrea cucullata]|uniref:uncharacterized protein LOC134235767 n=1 Tax=Saccostrea cuccullata TaxID=36930 RepID=UPI002ED3EC98